MKNQSKVAVAAAATLLATVPGAAQATPVGQDSAPAAEHSEAVPCVLGSLLTAATATGAATIAPAKAAICEKPPSERGWFFCQGFMLYRF